MRVLSVFVISILLGGAFWWGLHGNSDLIRHANAQNNRIYERYPGNTVENPNWSESADDMVLVRVGNGMRSYYIDKYEAVISNGRAWSVPGQTPTTKLTFQNAKDACSAAGKRICTTEEWRVACRDGLTEPHYFDIEQIMLDRCDFGRSNGYDKNDHPGLSDSHPKCKGSKLGLHHMYGNVVELTEGPNGNGVVLGMSYLGTKYYGAAYEGRPKDAMKNACEYTVMKSYPAGQHNEGLGFRCCRDAR